jgi:hypothetical protein
MINESITMECQFGKDHHRSDKEKSRSKQVYKFEKQFKECSCYTVQEIGVAVLQGFM